MSLEEWIDKFCRDCDNLEINRSRDNIFVINKRSDTVYILCKKTLDINRKNIEKEAKEFQDRR